MQKHCECPEAVTRQGVDIESQTRRAGFAPIIPSDWPSPASAPMKSPRGSALAVYRATDSNLKRSVAIKVLRKIVDKVDKSGPDNQARRRGRPPRRPFARELAAFRRLVWLPTSAAALTSATLGFPPMMDGLTVATLTFADDEVPG